MTFTELYNKEQENYPDSLLWFRLGDYYEVFGKDAIIMSRELWLVTHNRNFCNETVIMVTFPLSKANEYEKMLSEKGYKIAKITEKSAY
jgi:DNA mismatch repair protein MutS